MRIPIRSWLAVVLGAPALVTLQPAVPAGALPPAGPGVPAWAPDWMKDGSGNTGWDPGRTLAVRQAGEFDLIVAHSTTYDNYLNDTAQISKKV